ncbi:XRE family transcriptional regulator [Bifidobacterium tissieri]|uniref:XRE family transcriptional regulator n=1 Tax=Bifidobacterium tissieri TaxID=1630162 RepID=A0A261FJL9_9BIFI|nr:type II toxin-antitoxin system RelB/DinJ family antitoxin [Bifidobacterium tissieri]OZG59352.1 XRE family transcriptional regulator [Bifidobacterium tissieri]
MTTTTQGRQVRVNFRTDEETKKEASAVFDILGIDMSTALNMFLKQTIRDQSLPFTPSIEPTRDVEARRQAAARQGRMYTSVEELRAHYGD